MPVTSCNTDFGTKIVWHTGSPAFIFVKMEWVAGVGVALVELAREAAEVATRGAKVRLAQAARAHPTNLEKHTRRQILSISIGTAKVGTAQVLKLL